ncbi:transcriptional regulator [Sulfurimonas sp. SAG-AH-194-I05]|nr:transcriptional regulator [Sulfurimonas sp. SAG-AH-194-I05]MDF1875631.1 transcriptional regulator [Sulfurimonas sp. SAG-AH-194-I05]
MASKKTYDLALYRLSKILTMLSNNERVTLKELQAEFGVSLRTIQTDIYKRLNAFPIDKDTQGRLKFSDGFSLNKSMLDHHEMVLLSLVLTSFKDNQQFDKTSESILQKLIYPNFFNPYYIKHTSFEELEETSSVVCGIKEAIENKNIITITLCNTSVDVEAYKIASYDGFWYLFAKDIRDAKIKTFMISNIKEVSLTQEKHTTNLINIQQVLESTHSAWFDDGEVFEVVIEVFPEIAEYFLKRSFLQSQEILEIRDDGTLLIRFEITHYEDIDNLVKSWLPHIKIISPKHFKYKVYEELQAYSCILIDVHINAKQCFHTRIVK